MKRLRKSKNGYDILTKWFGKEVARVALDYILNGEGIWYDPFVVQSFRKFIFPFPLGSIVEMRDGSIAIVVKHGSSHHPEKYADGDFYDCSRTRDQVIRHVRSESPKAY